MDNDVNKPLIIETVDITHSRLIDLTRLADQAEPFYKWVERKFQSVLDRKEPLDQILQTATKDDLKQALQSCYDASGEANLPLLFDGVGRSYPHAQACYYFFSWIIRDAPRQRLEPLITRIMRISKKARAETEIHALSALIVKYRESVKTFSWDAVREIVIDRLEGSRRSIKGHEKEAVVRTALLAAIQRFYERHSNYGIYAGIQILDKQVKIGDETFDVGANLLDDNRDCIRRILMPIKTRETEGGGHAHLFTRDIMAAINAAKDNSPDDYLVTVIVARNWADREAENIREKVDHAVIFDISPNDFAAFTEVEQQRLNDFIDSILHDPNEPCELCRNE